ncbi:hypothetical protein APHAL10511_002543 [Amanita phalloides]|nr:hypothetical protein APHAL10511_002543 [Amanita phalloides]
MDQQNLENISGLLDREIALREKIKEQVLELDKKARTMVGLLNKIHSTPSESISTLIAPITPVLASCCDVMAALADLVPPNEFWRWKDMWSNSLRSAVFSAALVEYLTSGELITIDRVAEILGVKEEWKDRLALPVEDYLQGIISLVNELSRLAVNAVTMGDFDEPIKISIFVKDLYAGFSVLNLKNDALRRRFDSLKYDLKKIEEVVYDVSLRKLPTKLTPAGYHIAFTDVNHIKEDCPSNSTRPATSEELDSWSRTAESLRVLASKYDRPTTLESLEKVNRLISAWPTDDTIPAEGLEGVKVIHRKLAPGITEVKLAAEEELKAIDHAIEQLGILLALRRAPEQVSSEKRKRPRAPSPSAPVAIQLGNNRSVSITLPARPSPTGSVSREVKSRKEALAKQLPLQQGRKVAFRPGGDKSANSGADADESTWILALVTRCISAEKHKYEVQDAEPQEDGQPGLLYTTSLRTIIPLPDPNAPAGSPAHVNSYQEFPAGSTVMALYPDTSCFYRAEVIATPKDLQPTGRAPSLSKHMPMYKLKFEDDDNQEHSVAAQWVVEWPNIK